MVLQIGADAGQIVNRVDAHRGQVRRVADTRELEQPG